MPGGRSVLIASGDRLFAGAARAYLDARDGWRVVGVATDGLQALAAIGRQLPEALLVLHDLPRLGAAPLARQVRRRWPEVSVVVLGGAESDDARVLPPDADSQEVLHALASPARPLAGEEDRPSRPSSVALLGSLTPRERVILKHLAEGRVIGGIAKELGVSQHTVRTHMQNLYAKLGVHSRLDVVRFAAQHGLVGSGEQADSG
jgi:DNA-binding NarL/FixJ family response regulator